MFVFTPHTTAPESSVGFLYSRADVASSCNHPAGAEFPKGGENANPAVADSAAADRERSGLWTVFETPSARPTCDVVSRLTPGCKQWQRQGQTKPETRAHDAARIDKTLVSGLGEARHISKFQEPDAAATRGPTQQPHLPTVPAHKFPHQQWLTKEFKRNHIRRVPPRHTAPEKELPFTSAIDTACLVPPFVGAGARWEDIDEFVSIVDPLIS